MQRRMRPVNDGDESSLHGLSAHRMGINALHDAVAYLRFDSHVSQAEGFRALGRILVRHGEREIVAALHIVDETMLTKQQVGLSEAAWRHLACREGELVHVGHVPLLASTSSLRAKMYGQPLDAQQIGGIIKDIVAGHYSTIQLAAFVTACAGDGLSMQETASLTAAMVAAGQRMDWGAGIVADKHCVGGLPGNRTTPIVVAICAAAGVRMPKTSSRAITSPAGTADAMETLTNVTLDLATMRRVVLTHGGCLAWGGSVNLSPADDLLVRVERALDVDSVGQLVASVLSKKIAAGSTHVLIDIPIGPTAKVRDQQAAVSLKGMFENVAAEQGLILQVVFTDGTQPVGNGIGPALEARDVLRVLQRHAKAPGDLRERALLLAGAILEMAKAAPLGKGIDQATRLLDTGAAWTTFQAICKAQGGLRDPPHAKHQHPVLATQGGIVDAIDNRVLARVAKLAGAPDDPAAGVDLQVHVGQAVEPDETLFTIHTESPGALAYALAFLEQEGNPLRFRDAARRPKMS